MEVNGQTDNNFLTTKRFDSATDNNTKQPYTNNMTEVVSDCIVANVEPKSLNGDGVDGQLDQVASTILNTSESTPAKSDERASSTAPSQSSSKQAMVSPRSSQPMELQLQLEEQKDLRNILQTCLDESLRQESIYRAVLLFDEEQARPPTFHKKGLLNKVKTLKAEIAQQEMELEYYEKTLGETQDEVDYWMEQQQQNNKQQFDSFQQIQTSRENKGEKVKEKGPDDEIKMKLQHVRDAITRIRSRLSAAAEFNDLCGKHVANMGMSGAVQLATNLAIELENVQKRVKQTQDLNDQLSKKLLLLTRACEQEIANGTAVGDNRKEEHTNDNLTQIEESANQLEVHGIPQQEACITTSYEEDIQSSATGDTSVAEPYHIERRSLISSSPVAVAQNAFEVNHKANGPIYEETSSDKDFLAQSSRSQIPESSEQRVEQGIEDTNFSNDETDNKDRELDEEDVRALFIELTGGIDRVISLRDLLERWIDLQEMLDVEDLYHEELVAIFDGIPKVSVGQSNGGDIVDNEKIDLKGFLALYQGIEDLFVEDEYDSEDEEFDGQNITTLAKQSTSAMPSFSLWELLRRMVGISKKTARTLDVVNPYYKLPYRTKSSNDAMTV